MPAVLPAENAAVEKIKMSAAQTKAGSRFLRLRSVLLEMTLGIMAFTRRSRCYFRIDSV
jgi:hypothetical protein